MRAGARRMIQEGYRQSQAGTKGSLVDRDAMVYQAAVRAHALDVAEDGLVFGRLDLAGGETLYVGRVGVRTSEHDSLVIDWRAPAAEAFYRATPEDPHGRRTPPGAALPRPQGHRHRGRPARCPRAGDDLTIVGRRRVPRVAGPHPRGHHARHRRHDPARAGRGDPRARRRHRHRPRRPRHRQDRGGAAPRGVPPVPPPAAVRLARRARRRPEPPLHLLHRARPALARRGRRDPALARRPGRGRRRDRARPARARPRSRARPR